MFSLIKKQKKNKKLLSESCFFFRYLTSLSYKSVTECMDGVIADRDLKSERRFRIQFRFVTFTYVHKYH